MVPREEKLKTSRRILYGFYHKLVDSIVEYFGICLSGSQGDDVIVVFKIHHSDMVNEIIRLFMECGHTLINMTAVTCSARSSYPFVTHKITPNCFGLVCVTQYLVFYLGFC